MNDPKKFRHLGRCLFWICVLVSGTLSCFSNFLLPMPPNTNATFPTARNAIVLGFAFLTAAVSFVLFYRWAAFRLIADVEKKNAVQIHRPRALWGIILSIFFPLAVIALYLMGLILYMIVLGILHKW
jgi:hypothetical protein